MMVAKASNAKTTQSMLSIPKRKLTQQEQQKALQLAKQYGLNKQSTGASKHDSVSLSAEARSFLNAEGKEKSFANRSELDAYLRENYSAYKNGSVSISESYLDSCLADEEKLAELEKTLEEIPGLVDKIKENLPDDEQLLSANFEIDENGEMTSEASSVSVGFNAAKRAAELAGAMTPSDVGIVLAKLEKDLSDVKMGKCEDKIISLVKRMIRKANEKMSRLKDQEREKNGDSSAAEAASQIILSSTTPAAAPSAAAASATAQTGAN